MKLLSPTGSAAESKSAEEAPASSGRPRGLAMMRLALGGAICGGFVGSFGGAGLGVLLGLYRHDLSLGLDGALIGGLLLVLAGAIYGLFVSSSVFKS